MRANIIGISIGLVVVAVLWSTGMATAIIDRMTTTDFARAVHKLVECTKHPDTPACVKPIVIAQLNTVRASDMIDALSTELTPLQCHYVGHVVGQQLFTKNPDVEGALAQCNRTCDSACIHGVIGQAFAATLGHPDTEDENFDLEHLSAQDVQKVGKQLCINAGACHGVGHVLYQIYAEFEPAFAMCREIAGASITTCYNGVTMEYADVLTDRNMRSVPGVAFPDPKTLDTYCLFSRADERRACFRNFPRVAEITLERDGLDENDARVSVQQICDSYTKPDVRLDCFAGIGTHAAYDVITNTEAAVATCEQFTHPMDQAACIHGMVSVATGDRQRQLARLCNAQHTETMRASCYQGLFYTLDSGGATLDIPLLCGTDNRTCEEGAKKYTIDTWKRILTEFAE